MCPKPPPILGWIMRTPKPARPNPEIIPSPTFVEELQGPGSDIFSPLSYAAYSRSWSGVRTPNFIKFKDKGMLPENNHSVDITWDENSDSLDSRISVVHPTTDFSVKRSKHFRSWSWLVGPQAAHAARAQAKANTKLRSKVAVSGGLAIDLGEINQTVRMIATNVTRIAHAARALKSGNFGGVISALGIMPTRRFPGGPRGPRKERDPMKLLSNYWLEFIYGWKPLVSDVYESIKSLEKFLEKNQWVVAARGAGGDPIRSSKMFPRSVGGPNASGTNVPTYIGSEVASGNSGCKYTVYYKRDDHVKVFLAELGLTNPVDLAWELLPFSFVVDWFLPIGPWLEALHTFDGLVFVKGTRSLLTSETVCQEIGSSYRVHEPGAPFYDIVQYGSRVGTRIRYDRTALTAFPSANPPIPKSPVSVMHAANALALLVSIFKR